MVWPSPLHQRVDELNQYGAGMRLYFDFLQVAGFMLAFLGLVGLPLSFGCFSGRNPRIESFLARFSIGNLGDCGDSGEFCDLPEDMAHRVMAGSFSGYKVRDVTAAFGAIDALGALILFFAAMTFRFLTIPRLVEYIDEGAVTASDFALLVQNLPRRVRLWLIFSA